MKRTVNILIAYYITYNHRIDNQGRESPKTWKDVVFARFARIFRSHVIRIDIEGLIKSKNTTDDAMGNSADGVVEGLFLKTFLQFISELTTGDERNVFAFL